MTFTVLCEYFLVDNCNNTVLENIEMVFFFSKFVAKCMRLDVALYCTELFSFEEINLS